MSDVMKVPVSDGIADVRLNRPDSTNPLIDELFDALIGTRRSIARYARPVVGA